MWNILSNSIILDTHKRREFLSESLKFQWEKLCIERNIGFYKNALKFVIHAEWIEWKNCSTNEIETSFQDSRKIFIDITGDDFNRRFISDENK